MSIHAAFDDAAAGHAAASRAFDFAHAVHGLMSFHDASSEVSRFNRARVGEDVALHPFTLRVLVFCLHLAERSHGCFDPAVGAAGVIRGALPCPEGAAAAEQTGCWRDIEIDLSRGCARKARPLWLDLGGVAKGFAVDGALEALMEDGALQAVVDAGGDLRVGGAEPELVALHQPYGGDGTAPVVDLQDGALASSSVRRGPEHARAYHIDASTSADVAADLFTAVAAPSCMAADALTKVVLTGAEDASDILQDHAATAYLHDPQRGWRSIGADA